MTDSTPGDADLGVDALAQAIAREEQRLAHLESERSEARTALARLRAELASLGAGPATSKRLPVVAQQSIPRTAVERVRLFRSLFRGREDVFPTRFVSRKSGKPGYAPACRNKFVPGVCGLPTIKCGECQNQAFLAADDAAVVGHLTGRHVMGIYPLLDDETCWLLAVDFDKTTWEEDVGAFVGTCKRVGLPAAVERSRSGNGAHVWFFFSAPVAARAARQMGCYLITETMSRHYRLSMDSYDRLFPSQDTLPRGGFGNLIALPLQHEARQRGNSVFVDEQLQAYPGDGQWAYLASVMRIDVGTVEQIGRQATHTGSVVGVRLGGMPDEADATPWQRSPSRSPTSIVLSEPLPRTVRAVLAQKLFVETVGLPPPLLNAIKRLAAFQNPEFYHKESLRLSTAMTPRVISCAEDLPQHIGLPRGLCSELAALLREHAVTLEITDNRVSGDPLTVRFHGTLTPLQKRAANALLEHDIGVLVAPPGIGKTVVGTYLVAQRACSTLILVHRRPLLDQWVAQLSLFLGLKPEGIGLLGSGKRKATGGVDVAMIQSLVRKGTVQDVVARYGQVIVDECHHLPAVSFERVLAEVKARYVVGLTATPQRRDGHQPITEMQLGPVRFAVDPRSRAAARPFKQQLILRETAFMVTDAARPSIQELYLALAMDEQRNQLILADVAQALDDGRSPILLTERKDHLEYFQSQLAGVTPHLVVLHGGLSAKQRRALKDRLASSTDDERRLVLATGRYLGEGFDDPRLDTLFLALPVSWKGTLIQYTGRLHRLHARKTDVRIFDYVDRHVPMLSRMFERRMRGYRAIGYTATETRQGIARRGARAEAEGSETLFESSPEA